MDTNLVTALAEALKQMPVQKSGISDATWQILFNGLIAIALAWIGWKSHSSAKTSAANSETVKRIEKDVNTTATVLAAEKVATMGKILELSTQNAGLMEQVRSLPATVQSIPNPSPLPLPGVPIPNPIPLPIPITIVEDAEKDSKVKYTDLDPKKEKP